MLLRRFYQTLGMLTAGLVILAGVSVAHAGYKRIPCKCCASPEVFHSDFFGYYRTCWRAWPGGQPPCPVVGVVITEMPEGTGTPPPEKLPNPRPEAPTKK
jgi:hypothetical protein